jgi:hypothetical protein
MRFRYRLLNYAAILLGVLSGMARYGDARAGLIASNAAWQDGVLPKESPHGFDAGDRQQELFVVVDAAVACIEGLQHRLR